MMFKSLTLQNFQRHKKIRIDFDPGITSIIGPSDVGKSSIIRALRWLATNKPGGISFLRHGTREAQVILEMEKETIHRRRTKSINTYSIGDVEFKSFKSEPPQQVSDLLNLDVINFQEQHDSPFWFTNTAGEVSRQLNRIVDLEIIDRTLANLDKMRRDRITRAKVIEERLTEAKSQRKSMAVAKKMDRDLKSVEALQVEAKEAGERLANLESLVIEIERDQKKVNLSNMALFQARKIVEKGEQLEEIVKKIRLLEDTILKIEKSKKAATRSIPNAKRLNALHDEVKTCTQDFIALQSEIENIQSLKENFNNLQRELEEAENQFNEVKGETCPLCDRPW